MTSSAHDLQDLLREPPLWTGKPAIQLFLARAWWRFSPAIVVFGLSLGWAVGALAFRVGGGPLADHSAEAYRLAGLAAGAGVALLAPASLLAWLEHRGTTYAVTTSFVVIRQRRGFAFHTAVIPVRAITEVRVEEPLVLRGYGYGTIAIVSPGVERPGRYYAVKCPAEVAALILRLAAQSSVTPSSSAFTMSSM